MKVNHDKLIAAFDYAIAESKNDGYNMVVRSNYKTNIGHSTKRITDLAGFMMHHFGSAISVTRAESYATGLATGSIRPDIGRIICNISVWKKNGYPGAGDKVTIVVNGVDYSNHAGLGDQGLLSEVSDGDVDQSPVFKPSADDLYVNDRWLGAECEGSSINWDQAMACVVFFSHVSHYLGMDVDKDGDGRRSPIVGHLESTRRKIDPSGVVMGEVRARMEKYLQSRYPTGTPVVTPKPPLSSVSIVPLAPRYVDWRRADFIKITQRVMGISDDGIRGPMTISKTKEWQKKLGSTVDGAWGADTTEKYLLSLPNLHKDGVDRGPGVGFIQWVAGTDVDDILGPDTDASIKRMQAWAKLSADGIAGDLTKKAIIRN